VDEAEVDKDGEDLIELQNARTTATGVGSYSVPIDIALSGRNASIERTLRCLTIWHRFLGLDRK
jgi:hypothetical protein